MSCEYERNDAYGGSLVTRVPAGVVAAIVPWNTPLRSEVKKVIPALLAGCTVVLKPAPETPFAAEVLAELARSASVSTGVPGPATTGYGAALLLRRARGVRRPVRREGDGVGERASDGRFAASCKDGAVVTWAAFEALVPSLAARVQDLFSAHEHHTMATLRRDGAPRMSGTEIELVEGQLVLGMMAGARRAGDLRRDPRIALHTHTVDPPREGEDPSSWCGDAKVSGIAHEITPGDGDDAAHRFWIDLQEVVHTCVGVPADHLVIEVWRPGQGLVRLERR